jgi:hypothetical protein
MRPTIIPPAARLGLAPERRPARRGWCPALERCEDRISLSAAAAVAHGVRPAAIIAISVHLPLAGAPMAQAALAPRPVEDPNL